MTSVAHLLGMIHDLETEVEKRQMLQQYIPLCIDQSSYLSENALKRYCKELETVITRNASTDDKFKISLDVSSFRENEITVKAQDHEIVVIGAHNEREDEFGFVSRQFSRKFNIPVEYDSSTIKSLLTDGGELIIEAEKLKKEAAGIDGSRFIPIHQHASI
jgi:HSP20 family molecular chaperone IbpA